VLSTAGAAIGLSLVSPFPSQSFGKLAASLATAWALVVTIGSFLVGGYIAGRLRLTWGEGNPDEVEFRDGVHGFLVWSLSIFLGAFLASTAGTATTLVGAQVGKASVYTSETNSILTPSIDLALRGAVGASTQSAGTDAKDEMARALSNAASTGQLAGADRTYLAQIVATRTGLPQADAEKRIDNVYAEARRAIDEARKAVVLVGLVTTTALLFGLAAAWYAAQRGGHHRDNNIPAKFGLLRRSESKA
jgi:hypothetical protein